MSSPKRLRVGFGELAPRKLSQDTPLRYHLHLDIPGFTDTLLHHPSGTRRMVSYTNPGHDVEDIRTYFESQSMVLGEEIGLSENPLLFLIPQAARPIKYDAAVTSAEPLTTFGDEKLFFAAGRILGAIAGSLQLGVKEDTDIADLLTVVDFSEREGVFLTPGFEATLVDYGSSEGAYTEKMIHSLGSRFIEQQEWFTLGFSSQLDKGKL